MIGTTTIRVSLSPGGENRSYEVLVRNGILNELAEGTLSMPDASALFVVTDSNVVRLYGEKLRSGLSRAGRRVGLVVFPAGEKSKSVQNAWVIASKLSKLGADREGVVLALGGGVVGDLAGFVASVYKRGMRYIQLPTTLLAQVDSSIGGKTGVDAPWGKNQIGTFHQPEGVFTDPLALRTLPRRERLNGLAEIAKCAIIADKRMFSRLLRMPEFDCEFPGDLIIGACKIKARVVSKDEKEANLRAILNYGHTVGHAIESSTNYRLGHGACVILGMMVEGWIAFRLGILKESDFEKQSLLLTRLSIEFNIRRPALNRKTLFKFAMADKKTISSSLKMSLPAELGRMHNEGGSYKIPVSKRLFEESIDHLGRTFPSGKLP